MIQLHEISVVDVEDSAEGSNGIQINDKRKSFVVYCTSANEKVISEGEKERYGGRGREREIMKKDLGGRREGRRRRREEQMEMEMNMKMTILWMFKCVHCFRKGILDKDAEPIYQIIKRCKGIKGRREVGHARCLGP